MNLFSHLIRVPAVISSSSARSSEPVSRKRKATDKSGGGGDLACARAGRVFRQIGREIAV